MTPGEAGTLLMVQPLVQAILSPLCGRLADSYPAATVATIGMSLCAAGLGIAACVGAATPLWIVICMLVLLGVGFAMFSSPNTSVIMGSISSSQLGVASGLVASMRSLGMMASMTIITVILSSVMGGHTITPETYPAFLRSMHMALTVFACLCAVGVLCSFGRLGSVKETVEQ